MSVEQLRQGVYWLLWRLYEPRRFAARSARFFEVFERSPIRSRVRPIGGEGDSHTVLDTLVNKDSRRGFDQIEKESLIDFVEDVVETLPERQQTILGLYYTENLTLREIGDILDLTEARISQILGKILLTLRGRLTEELSAPD